MAPLRVLLVDDEALARLRLRSLLQDCADPASEVVGEAGDADEALALLRGQPCDLLLLDIGMPGPDGLQLAAALRALPTPPAWSSSPRMPSMRCAPSSSTRSTT